MKAKFTRQTAVLSFKLTTVETLILGALLAALAGVQLHISMSAQAHAALAMAIIVIGGLVHPLTQGQLLGKLPVQFVAVLDAVLGAVLILNQSFAVGSFWRTVIAVVIVTASTLGFGPTTVPAVEAKA